MRRGATKHSMKSHWRLPLQRQVLAEGVRSDFYITVDITLAFAVLAIFEVFRRMSHVVKYFTFTAFISRFLSFPLQESSITRRGLKYVLKKKVNRAIVQ